jgi:hypothetical protein
MYDDSELSSKARPRGNTRQSQVERERKKADKMHMQRERNRRRIEKQIRS